jgi:molybdate transport system regulatory protein
VLLVVLSENKCLTKNTMPKKRSSQSVSPVPRLRVLMGSYTAMGPGRADLLEAIDRTGSISGAAKEMQMSYRRAWVLLESTNAAFVEPLVLTSAGGSGGGGATLTDFGRGVLERYREMERKAADAVSSDFAIFSKLLKTPPSATASDKPPAKKTASATAKKS